MADRTASGPAARVTNWAGNIVYSGPLHRPTSVPELQAMVTGLPHLRALGTGHSFNRIADGENLVTVADLPRRLELQPDDSVIVSGATRYGELAPFLHERGRALHNMGSLPHISVAGAAATGTHGAGHRNRCMAAAVSAVEFVTADGRLRTASRADPDFGGCVLALGALGIVTALTVETEPTYQIHQTVYDGIPLPAVIESLDEALNGGYSVSLFTLWDTVAAWVKSRESSPPDYLGHRPADGPRHPIPSEPGLHCTVQGGVAGPWYERLPHFRLDFTPSSGEELQSEFFVDRAAGAQAVAAVAALREQLAPVLQTAEIRAVAADDLWLSPATGRDSVALHFTWIDDWAAVLPVVAAVERALADYEPRPHWGKVFTMPPAQVAARYPRFDDFRELVARLDPDGRFCNEFLAPYLEPAR